MLFYHELSCSCRSKFFYVHFLSSASTFNQTNHLLSLSTIVYSRPSIICHVLNVNLSYSATGICSVHYQHILQYQLYRIACGPPIMSECHPPTGRTTQQNQLTQRFFLQMTTVSVSQSRQKNVITKLLWIKTPSMT